MGTWGLYSEFGIRYEQNHSRNEFSGHENIKIDTLKEVLCAIFSVLCSYTSEILKSEKFQLPRNGYLGAIQ